MKTFFLVFQIKLIVLLMVAGNSAHCGGISTLACSPDYEIRPYIQEQLADATMPTDTSPSPRPVTNSETRAPLSVETPSSSQVSSAAPVETKLRHGLNRKPSANPVIDSSTNKRFQTNHDAVLELNLCAGSDGSAIVLFTKKKRRWNHFKVSEAARIIVRGVNAEKEKITINTIGLLEEYEVEKSPLALFDLTSSAKSEKTDTTEIDTRPPGLSEEGNGETEKEVQSNFELIGNYLLALQEKRRALSAQACFTQDEIDSWLASPIPSTQYDRWQLQANQERKISQLRSDNPLRKNAEEQLEALRVELDKWMALREGTIVLGPPMPVRGKDYIRFEVKRKELKTDTEVTLPYYDIPVYGNFRINVSTGLFFNGLVNDSYLTVTEDLALPGRDDSDLSDPLKKVPVRENAPRVSLGLGALVHFYYTSSWIKGNLAPALSAGASLNGNGKYSGVVGLSAIVGGSQRLVLTGGIAIGQVDRLKKPYEEGKAYSFTEPEFPLTLETKSNFFFGLTWNLSSKRNPVLN